METSITLVFLRCDKEPLFTRIKFQYNRLLIKDPYLSCEVKTWIIISYGKLKMQKLKLAVSIVLEENLIRDNHPMYYVDHTTIQN